MKQRIWCILVISYLIIRLALIARDNFQNEYGTNMVCFNELLIFCSNGFCCHSYKARHTFGYAYNTKKISNIIISFECSLCLEMHDFLLGLVNTDN